jgi:murein DD-endopeptidase MepM/ murein hydrolase activator NlpD
MRGDTVYALSRQYGVSVETIIETNGLKPPYYLEVGQWITLPRERRHVVTRGETLYGVSRLYAVDPHALARANNLAPPYGLREGQRLSIPVQETTHSLSATQPEVVQPQTQPTADTVIRPSAEPTSVVVRSPLPPVAVPPPPPTSRSGFMWPLQGEIISRFGTKTKGLRNDGINIAAKKGTPIRAAENGVVAYAGNELRGFGNMILIKHAGGWVTAYAHTEVLLVGRGDKVRKGQIIARVGTSGGVSQPQLHFEIRKGKQAVDPAQHLVKDTA